MSEKADIQKPKGTTNKSKEELLRSNQEYLNALENQIADLKSNSKDWAKKRTNNWRSTISHLQNCTTFIF